MSGTSRRTSRLRRVLILGALFAVIADALFIVYLDRVVTPQFEGRRWTLPAQVYAQPLELYAGLSLSADALAPHWRQAGDHSRLTLLRRGASRRACRPHA